MTGNLLDKFRHRGKQQGRKNCFGQLGLQEDRLHVLDPVNCAALATPIIIGASLSEEKDRKLLSRL